MCPRELICDFLTKIFLNKYSVRRTLGRVHNNYNARTSHANVLIRYVILHTRVTRVENCTTILLLLSFRYRVVVFRELQTPFDQIYGTY